MSSDVKYDILPKCVRELMICFADWTELVLIISLALILSASLDQLNSSIQTSQSYLSYFWFKELLKREINNFTMQSHEKNTFK